VSSKASDGDDLVHVGIWHYINVMYKEYMKVSKGTAKKRKEQIDNTKNVKVRRDNKIITLPSVSSTSSLQNMKTFEIKR